MAPQPSEDDGEFRGSARARLDQHSEKLNEHHATLQKHGEKLERHEAFIGLARLVLLIVIAAASLVFYDAQHLSDLLLGISK